MNNLLANSDLYEGKFVVIDNFDDKNVLFSTSNTNELVEEVEKKGIQSPYVLYVPENGSINIL